MDVQVRLNQTIDKLKSFKAEALCIRETAVKSNGFIFWTSKVQKREFKTYYRERSLGAAITDSEAVRGWELFQLLASRNPNVG